MKNSKYYNCLGSDLKELWKQAFLLSCLFRHLTSKNWLSGCSEPKISNSGPAQSLLLNKASHSLLSGGCWLAGPRLNDSCGLSPCGSLVGSEPPSFALGIRRWTVEIAPRWVSTNSCLTGDSGRAKLQHNLVITGHWVFLPETEGMEMCCLPGELGIWKVSSWNVGLKLQYICFTESV